MQLISTDNVIFLALGATFVTVIVGLSVIIFLAKCNLRDCMGKAQWDFTSSWATTLTAVGALLTTILATQQMTFLPFTAFSLFFALLVLIAPVIYNTTGTLQEVDTDQGKKAKQYQGRVWGFLLASLFTLWGEFGQLGLIFPLLQILPGPAATAKNPQFLFPDSIRTPFQVVLLIAIVLVFLYAIRSMYWIAKTQVSQEAKTQMKDHVAHAQRLYTAQVESYKGKAPTLEEVQKLSPVLPNWSLL